MFIRRLIPCLILGAATLLPVVAAAEPAKNTPCVLLEHQVTSVTPYRVLTHYGRGSTERLAGARVNVRAEPGLTAEWLQLTIQQHLTKMQGTTMAGCPLDLDNLRVEVDSAGAGFTVKLIAQNAAQAKEVLHRAQLWLQ